MGGTFTDAVIVSDDGRVRIAMVRSTPERIEAGFIDGLRLLLERAGTVAADVDHLAHGSTVATNAIVQRRLARTGLITNDGFRDVLAIGTQMRRHVYDLWAPDPIGGGSGRKARRSSRWRTAASAVPLRRCAPRRSTRSPSCCCSRSR
ncbi:MAG TPA: hydantoinase/oxoprolinase N-terminal domain-containing protein, partial [Gaiellales bacterium]